MSKPQSGSVASLSFSVSNWFGGLSSDDFLGTGSQFAYLNNIDGIRSSDYAQLSRAPDGVLDNLDSLPVAQVDEYFFTKSGKVYSFSGNEVADISNVNNNLINAVKFGGYYYWFIVSGGSTTIGRMLVSEADSTWSDNVSYNESYLTRSGESGYAKTYNASDDTLYYTSGNRVRIIRSDGSIDSGIVFEDTVVGITRTGTLYEVFLANGKYYMRNGFSKTFSRELKMQLTGVSVFSSVGMPHVLGGGGRNDSVLSLYLQGQFQQISKTEVAEIGPQSALKFSYFSPNYKADQVVVQYANMTVHPAWNGSGYFLALWGNPKQGFPFSHQSLLSVNENGDEMSEIGFISIPSQQKQYIYFGWGSGVSYGVSRINIEPLSSSGFVQSGQIYTKKLGSGSFFEQKQIERIDLGASNIDANNTVQVNASADGGAFLPLGTLDDTTNDPVSPGVYVIRGGNPNLPKRFRTIQFRIDLSGDGTSTPRVRQFDVFLRGTKS